MENIVCPIRLANHEFYQDMFPTGQLGSLEVGLDVSMTFSWGRGRPVVIRGPLWLHVCFFFRKREVSRSILKETTPTILFGGMRSSLEGDLRRLLTEARKIRFLLRMTIIALQKTSDVVNEIILLTIFDH